MKNFLNVGYNNFVALEDVVAITSIEGAQTKRNIAWAKEHNHLIDATQGRKTRSVIYTKSNHIVLSSFQPDTLAGRLETF